MKSVCAKAPISQHTHFIVSGANLLTMVTINWVNHLPRAMVKQPCEKDKISNMFNTYSMIWLHVHYAGGGGGGSRRDAT